ncbi:MAG: VCBS repeat-containing protein [Ignavibacteriae bacterium]|nr:VCBS repeat-containing protein [Ignavibacteriota bacterium]
MKSQRDTVNGQLIREIEFPNKLDSEEPAIVDLNPSGGSNSKTIVFGSWSEMSTPIKNGSLYAVWFDLSAGNLQTATANIDSIMLQQIAHGTDGEVQGDEIPVFRSSPMIWNFGDGETAFFTWMGDFTKITSSRISAVGLSFSQANQQVEFTPKWTKWYIPMDSVVWPLMDWKPTIALLPRPGRDTLIVSAGGRGSTEGSQSGDYGYCNDSAIGWVGAFKPNGDVAWANRYVNEGNIRSSCAVADVDNDGRFETLVAFGCRGMFRCYDDSGNMKWEYQLGTNSPNEWTRRSICSPSIGDVDGDGFLEVIVSAFDGYVTCLGGPVSSTEVTRHYDVAEKWNMVSIPLAVNDYTKDSLFPTASSSAFAFQAGYTAHNILENGTGYWLKFDSAQQVQMTGFVITSDTIDVTAGWNMIGSVSSQVAVSSIVTNPDDNIEGNIFGYEYGYVIATEIVPGKSYWVKATHGGQVILNSALVRKRR